MAMNCHSVQIEFAFKMAHVVCCGQKNLIASVWFFKLFSVCLTLLLNLKYAYQLANTYEKQLPTLP